MIHKDKGMVTGIVAVIAARVSDLARRIAITLSS